jgi:hypothetical protein
VEHGEISKLSGYDYDTKEGRVVANRVGWTESDKPHAAALRTGERHAKKAGKVRVLQPKTWKKENRVKAADTARQKGIESWRATEGGPATPGKYTEAVWAHRNTKTNKVRHTADAGMHQREFKGSYRTWEKGSKGNKAAKDPAVAKRRK